MANIPHLLGVSVGATGLCDEEGGWGVAYDSARGVGTEQLGRVGVGRRGGVRVRQEGLDGRQDGRHVHQL